MIVSCPGCSRKVSDRAGTCPKCGADLGGADAASGPVDADHREPAASGPVDAVEPAATAGASAQEPARLGREALAYPSRRSLLERQASQHKSHAGIPPFVKPLVGLAVLALAIYSGVLFFQPAEAKISLGDPARVAEEVAQEKLLLTAYNFLHTDLWLKARFERVIGVEKAGIRILTLSSQGQLEVVVPARYQRQIDQLRAGDHFRAYGELDLGGTETDPTPIFRVL